MLCTGFTQNTVSLSCIVYRFHSEYSRCQLCCVPVSLRTQSLSVVLCTGFTQITVALSCVVYRFHSDYSRSQLCFVPVSLRLQSPSVVLCTGFTQITVAVSCGVYRFHSDYSRCQLCRLHSVVLLVKVSDVVSCCCLSDNRCCRAWRYRYAFLFAIH